jgi:arylsulfatase A-like enzyme
MKPKHVIWITCDHLRWDNIGAHGQTFAHTPNIDRLVNGGISFSQCFAQSPLCMPSRASFMTGCYPYQTGVIENGVDLDPNFPNTVARCFKAAGYQTAQIGKLHFEHHEDIDLESKGRNEYGFDVFWCDEEPGCYDGPYMRWLETEHPEQISTFRVPRPNAPARADADNRKPKVLEAPWELSFSGWVAEQSCRYLGAWGGGRAKAKDENHFIHMGFYAPHPPLNPTRDMMEPLNHMTPPKPTKRMGEYKDKVGPLAGMLERSENQGLKSDEIESYQRHFAAMVTGVDLAVGKLLRTLEDNNVLDDTLIIFGSDHGDFCGDHHLVSKGIAWYDSVARVPLVLHWPSGLKGGRTIDGLTEMVDVLPTLLELSEQTPPKTMSGKSMAEHLKEGRDDELGRQDVLSVHAPGHLMLRSQNYKYLRHHQKNGDPFETLFHLANDPEEFTNVASDPSHREALDHMRTRAMQRFINASHPAKEHTYRY